MRSSIRIRNKKAAVDGSEIHAVSPFLAGQNDFGEVRILHGRKHNVTCCAPFALALAQEPASKETVMFSKRP
jgi:hypothetical protein